MKCRYRLGLAAITLCAALAIPGRLAAQQAKPNRRHYKLVELGTFGGPTSYINNVGNGGPYMNRHGDVVGSSMTSILIPPNQNGYSCPSPPEDVFHAMEWSNGVIDLGSLGDAGNCSNALGINDQGETVGTSENGRVDPVTGVLQLRAVLWKNGKIKNLGTFGGNHSFAASINNRGQIAGFALNKAPDNFSLFAVFFGGPSAGTQTRAFLWENGHKRDLHTLGGPDALATFVNDRAQVAGISYTNSTPNSTTGYPTVDPFLWMKDKGMVDLGTLGGTRGLPTGLNNRGEVIGQSNLAGDQIADPFVWDGQKMVDMFTDGIGGNFQIANAINDAGEIVGGAAFPNRISDAALWRRGVITDLGTLPGDCFSQAFALNSRGQVVGGSVTCDGGTIRAFLWQNGEIVDLNTLVAPNSGFLLVETNAINDRGEIVGNALPSGCTLANFSTCSQAYVLIPCERDHARETGCEEGVEDTTAIQNNPAPVTPNPTGPMGVGLTPKEIAAQIRTRFGRNRGLGPWMQK